MRINLRRGLNRVFFAFALCWYPLAGIVIWPDLIAYFAPPAPPEGYKLDPVTFPSGEVLFVLLVPGAIYVAGLMISWIVKGFVRD